MKYKGQKVNFLTQLPSQCIKMIDAQKTNLRSFHWCFKIPQFQKKLRNNYVIITYFRQIF